MPCWGLECQECQVQAAKDSIPFLNEVISDRRSFPGLCVRDVSRILLTTTPMQFCQYSAVSKCIHAAGTAAMTVLRHPCMHTYFREIMGCRRWCSSSRRRSRRTRHDAGPEMAGGTTSPFGPRVTVPWPWLIEVYKYKAAGSVAHGDNTCNKDEGRCETISLAYAAAASRRSAHSGSASAPQNDPSTRPGGRATWHGADRESLAVGRRGALMVRGGTRIDGLSTIRRGNASAGRQGRPVSAADQRCTGQNDSGQGTSLYQHERGRKA